MRWAHAAAWALSAILWVAGCGDPTATTQPAESNPKTAAESPDSTEDGADVAALPGRIHIVQPGDTLTALAQKYYGDPRFYRKIYYANDNRLRDPNDLPIGIKLIIPP